MSSVFVPEMPFSKLSGSGNDFILIDNRKTGISAAELSQMARRLCQRKFSVGADGLIAIEASEKADFRWQFFNSDGSSAEMCGNGGRCAARFALARGIAQARLCFETLAGPIRAEVFGTRVKLELLPPEGFTPEMTIPLETEKIQAVFVNTMVPHTVVCVDEIEAVDVKSLGRQIRFHDLFQPAGTNANFVQMGEDSEIVVRTYERGVEDETLACGTGAVASAITASWVWGLTSPVDVRTRGGEVLTVYFSRDQDGFKNIFLEGETFWVYDGKTTEEAFSSLPPS